MSVQNSFKKIGVKDSFLDEVFYPSTFDAVMKIFTKKFPDLEIIYGNEKKFSQQYENELQQNANGQFQITDEKYVNVLVQEENSQCQNTDENKDIEFIQEANTQYQITDEKYSKEEQREDTEEEQQEDTEEEQQEAPLYDECSSYTALKESFEQITSL